jgi:hypothetical protein
MAIHLDKTIQRRKNSENRTALAEEEEQILKCLGAAVLMRWNTVPTRSSNGSSSIAPAASVICSKQRHSRDG